MTHTLTWRDTTLLIDGLDWDTPGGLHAALHHAEELKTACTRELIRLGIQAPLMKLRDQLSGAPSTTWQALAQRTHLKAADLSDLPSLKAWMNRRPAEDVDAVFKKIHPSVNPLNYLVLLGLLARDPGHLPNWHDLDAEETPGSRALLWTLVTTCPDVLRGPPESLSRWLREQRGRDRLSPYAGYRSQAQWDARDVAEHARTVPGLNRNLGPQNLWKQADIAVTYEHPRLSPAQRVPLVREWAFLLRHTDLMDERDPVTDEALGFLLVVAARHLAPDRPAAQTIQTLIHSLGPRPGELNRWLRTHLTTEVQAAHAPVLLRALRRHRRPPRGTGAFSYAQTVPHLHQDPSETGLVHRIEADGTQRDPNDHDIPWSQFQEDHSLIIGSTHLVQISEHLMSSATGDRSWAVTISRRALWTGTDWTSSITTRTMELSAGLLSPEQTITPIPHDISITQRALEQGGHQRRIALDCMHRLAAMLNMPRAAQEDEQTWLGRLAGGQQRALAHCDLPEFTDDELPF